MTTPKVFYHLISSDVSSHPISNPTTIIPNPAVKHNSTHHQHNHISYPIHQSHFNNYDLIISCFQYLNIISQQNIININLYIYNIPLYLYIYIYIPTRTTTINHQTKC